MIRVSDQMFRVVRVAYRSAAFAALAAVATLPHHALAQPAGEAPAAVAPKAKPAKPPPPMAAGAGASASSMMGAKGLRFNFASAEITEMIAAYAKASGRKFIVDPSVRGRISIYTPEEVPLEEAFNLLASALANNGFSYSEQGDTFVIMSARNVQRNLIPVVTELPNLKPERMISMVFTLKNISADDVNRNIRMLPSKDGEMTPFEPTNKLIVTDFTSNLHRIARMIELLDQPAVKGVGASKGK